MERKDEMTALIARTVLDFANSAGVDWHSIYFRYYSSSKNYSACESTWRNLRALEPIKISGNYLELLRKLMSGLFDEAERGTGARPLVAVVDMQPNQKYSIHFHYDDPRAMDISLIGLGTANSYFDQGAIDIPEEVKQFQRDMAAQGQTGLPG